MCIKSLRSFPGTDISLTQIGQHDICMLAVFQQNMSETILSHCWWTVAMNVLFLACTVRIHRITCADQNHKSGEVEILAMEGSCSCKHPSGFYVNLTKIASVSDYPRFMDIEFPQTKDDYLYFYNPCSGFTWPRGLRQGDDVYSGKNSEAFITPASPILNATKPIVLSASVLNGSSIKPSTKKQAAMKDKRSENVRKKALDVSKQPRRRQQRKNQLQRQSGSWWWGPSRRRRQRRKDWGSSCDHAAVCQYDRHYDYEVVVTQDTDDDLLYCQLNYTINRIQLIYKGKKWGHFEYGGWSVTLECDPDQNEPILTPLYDAQKDKTYWNHKSTWKYVTLKHKCCCPGECATGHAIIYNRGNGGIGDKTVFFVTIGVVALGVFLVLFWIYNYQSKKEKDRKLNRPKNVYGALADYFINYNDIHIRETQIKKDKDWKSNRPKNVYGALADYFINYNDIHIRETIGEGGFGVVYKGKWRNTEVAVKHLRENMAEPNAEAFKKEATVLCSLRHHNIVQFMGVCLVHPHYCIITEFMEGGSLATILHVKKQIISWKTRLKWASDAAKGMAFLHAAQPPIMHRDLKSDNLLVDENGLVKVADFGTVKIIESVFGGSLEKEYRSRRKAHSQRAAHQGSGFHTHLVGTVRWAAPEVIPRKYQTGPVRYSTAADVYSYGITIYELISNKRPFSNLSWDHEVMDAVHSNLRPEIPKSCIPEIGRFIKSCWEQNPRMRPNFAQILTLLLELRAIIPPNR